MNYLLRYFSNRRRVLVLVSVILTVVLLARVFELQIIRGADYQDNYRLRVERKEIISATRGNIYDRNGNILAYNKLANAVTIEDIGNYSSEKERNETLNTDLYEVIKELEKNNEIIYSDFGIYLDSMENYVFRDEGTKLKRFRADIFGHSNIEDLKFNKRLNLDESTASADEIMDYLCDIRYDIPKDYPKKDRYNIAMIRYRIGLNTYSKYISTTIASDVSDETVAYIVENKYRFTGIDIEQQSMRVYEDARCFANILGYTGTISTEEYEELSKTDDTYSTTDIIGKSGIEQYMNKVLMGKKGYQTVYVDSLGNVLETAEITDQESGSDVYLSIDKDLTIKTYNLLEQEIAGILLSKIINEKQYDTSAVASRDDILVPIYDVYYALIDNRLIATNKRVDLTDAEKIVYGQLEQKFEEVCEAFARQLHSDTSPAYENLSEEYQEYSTYLVKKLKSDDVGIFDSKLIDNNESMQIEWMSEKVSINDYLKFAIDKGWISIDRFVGDNEFLDASEVYTKLIDYCIELLKNDEAFKRTVSYYAVIQDRVSIGALCAILYDQGLLEPDAATRSALLNGSMDTYSFIVNKIRNLEITPGQLGLDPCSGSCVITDPNSGEILALVSYPGYDSNRLANNLDSEYYAYLSASESNPLYNHATQERTAPGSTFKMVSAAAGLEEGVIDLSTIIDDEGKFTKVDNEPECWIYPNSTHGEISVVGALRDSCNYFFYEVGWRLAGGDFFNDGAGIEKITKYASDFGFDKKTGVELEESEPSIATEYPVMAAIGQSNHNYTTVSLSRYITAVANSGTVYDYTLLSKVVDKDGNITDTYAPKEDNKISDIDYSTWNAIHSGMRQVVENMDMFEDFPINIAGKTGTAQQSKRRPNHALFLGYAPYENPQIAIACRISFGYTSHNAADFAKKVLAEYFNVGDYNSSAGASSVNTTNRITD